MYITVNFFMKKRTIFPARFAIVVIINLISLLLSLIWHVDCLFLLFISIVVLNIAVLSITVFVHIIVIIYGIYVVEGGVQRSDHVPTLARQTRVELVEWNREENLKWIQ